MSLPFTPEQFFDVFARYNNWVWPMQILLFVLAVMCVGLLWFRGPLASRAITFCLTFFWCWMAVAYHFCFFTSINPAAWIFGTVCFFGALAFLWFGVWQNSLHFYLNRGLTGLVGMGMIVFALFVYPLVGYFNGHRYPAFPTFGLPCPTTIFTIGLLLFIEPPHSKVVFIAPLCWSVVGSFAAFKLGIHQDLGLLVAGIIGFVTLIYPKPAQQFRSQ